VTLTGLGTRGSLILDWNSDSVDSCLLAVPHGCFNAPVEVSAAPAATALRDARGCSAWGWGPTRIKKC
jgi:hypothetical protein